jgi:hypothetical protein
MIGDTAAEDETDDNPLDEIDSVRSSYTDLSDIVLLVNVEDEPGVS